MTKDIVPELLDKIQGEFKSKTAKSKILKKKILALQSRKVTHKDSNEFAIELGKILADTFKGEITKNVLPDGKMYYNIAKRLIEPNMKSNYDLVSDYSRNVQDILNKESHISLKAIKPELNQDRIDGIINKICDYDDFNQGKWLLDEPIKNFTQSIVDDTIKTNAEFQYNSGLGAKIIRRDSGNCCEWCANLAGVYEYPDVPKEVYHRHQRCRCTVEYFPGDGKKQDVWSKKWKDIDKSDKIEERIKFSKSGPDFYVTPNSKVFKKEHRKYIGKSNYEKLMKKYTNEESRKFIRTSYRKNANIGDGSTYAVRKMEIETGLNLSRNGRNHAKKVEDLIKQINKSLSKDLPEKDRQYLEMELKRLKEVE